MNFYSDSYNKAPVPVQESRPAWQLATNRSMLKMFLLGILTLGIYPTVINSYMTEDINLIASRHDGKRTVHETPAALLTAVTLGIYYLVWKHKMCNRIQDEMTRRGIQYSFNAKHFWLLEVLGSLLGLLPLGYVATQFSFLADRNVLNAYVNSPNAINQLGVTLRNVDTIAMVAFAAGAVIFLVLHLIYLHKYCSAMNLLAADYNERG